MSQPEGVELTCGSEVPLDDRPLETLARNVVTRYLAITAEMIVGVVTLPFNLHHLGAEAYGLWMLTASVTIHFSILDMGYGGALVKFVAQYRAKQESQALNQIASTLFYLFAVCGVLAYLVVIGLSFNLDHVFKITAAEAATGQWILLIIGLNVALNFPFSVFGGICCGFQRYDINNWVAIVSSLMVAAVNIGIVLMGFGVIPLVAATTAVRLLTYVVYRRNAYQVYPALRLRPSLVRRARLREVTGFSVYASIIDWANKLNYELDEVVIGIFMGSVPVAIWAVADRIISGTQRLTNQSNTVLFPLVVDSDVSNRMDRLQRVLLEGTRLSLATVIPIAAVLVVLADPIVRVWVGPKVLGAAPCIQILAFAVALRVGNATSTTLLKGAGHVRYLAVVNIVTGLVNLGMSAALVKPLGLEGVAIGTVIPVALASCLVIFPAACRRADVPVPHALARAVWPAVWPGLLVGAALAVVRPFLPVHVVSIAVACALTGLLYAAVFVVAVGRRDRREYFDKARELLGRRGALAAA